MEPWRKRGFVPDSDDDDEFDSLEASDKVVDHISHPDVDLEYLPVPASTTVVESKSPAEAPIQTELNASTIPPHTQDASQGSVELAASPVIKRKYTETPKPLPEEPTKKLADHPEERQRSLSHEDQTPKPRKVTKTYGKRSSATKRRITDLNNANDSQIAPPNPDGAIYDFPSSPAEQDWSARRSRRRGRDSTPKPSTPTKDSQSSAVLRPKAQDVEPQSVVARSRSSSPDDLIVVEYPPTKPPPENVKAKEHTLPPPPPDSEDDSPLSSPPSSIRSIQSPVFTAQGPDTSRDESQHHTLMEGLEPHASRDVSEHNALMEDLSQIEIPQELLDQVQTSQPTRRTFRERNAIQMHPYALEMAKYQRLMKEGGIRPVRAMIEEQRKRAKEATDESQEQEEFDPDALRSSSPPEEFLPQRHERRQGDETNGAGSRQNLKSNSPLKRVHSAKRRRKSYSGALHASTQGASPRPQVVIDTTTPPGDRRATAFMDPIYALFPSSPPNSDDRSGTQTPRPSDVFRFPPGFTPPTTTTPMVLDSESATPRADESNADEPNAVELISEEESDGEVSDASDASSAAPGETAEEREIRRIQKQTRGVLPASWIRLEARQRLEQQKASQNRNAAAPRTDGKGVARKVVRKSGLARTTSLVDFGFSDDSEDEVNAHAEPQNAESNNAEKPFASATPFDDSRTGDAMEDNRIDYMLPTIPRNSSNNVDRRKSLKRPKPKESAQEREHRAKRARLKKQTRLTDGSYGARKTKQSSSKPRAVPRLGILDAPDVATRPQEEQPLFLRVAARRARSRKDAGRRSPTRKFVQLSSKSDTRDANQSLQEWRRGKIKQTKITRSQSKARKRQPFAGVSNQNRSIAQFAERTENLGHASAPRSTQPDVIMVDSDDATGQENIPSTAPAAPAPLQLPPSVNTPAVRSTQLERHGHQWVVRRNMPISSLQRNAARPAVTSVSASKENRDLSRNVFGQSLNQLNRDYRHKQDSRGLKPSLTLDRYISDAQSASPSADNLTQAQQVAQTQQRRKRLRKPTPRQIIIDSAESPDDDNQDVMEIDSIESNSGSANQLVSSRPTAFNLGLFNWQSSYSIEFGIQPLRDGTFFHESTFIGSGEFFRSLQLAKRNLDHDARLCSITIKDQVFQWGSWNDTVSSQLGSVFEFMIAEFEQSMNPPEANAARSLSTASLVYRSIINYVTDNLSFIDPIDRKSFVHRVLGLISWFREPISVSLNSRKDKQNEIVGLASYNLVFANQMRQIADHQLVEPVLANDAVDLVKASANDVISLALSDNGITSVRDLLDEAKKPILRDKGIHDEFPFAAAFVIAEQLLRSSDSFSGVLADIQSEVCTKNLVTNQKDVANLERAWRKVFTTLPLDEIDHHGIARRDSRFKIMQGNWNLVKNLLSPALDDTDANSARLPISFNSYCRVLFQRCHRLINVWGWKECKPILDTLYDFFALKSLNNLRLEESRGSPAFLDQLNSIPSLDIQVGEPCFHTLLKIIASGLRSMALRYDKKKMRNFAWRLLPNHGRVYPKDKELRHEDLDALRNHHDLLCTLYWSVPDGCRPRLETIRDLVHPATSHQETCSINIQSWIRLVRFKLSTKEDVSDLEPFADWHSYFMVELQQQHSQARSEIEAQNKDNKFASKELVESTISRNQRQIESLLKMGLSGLRTATELAPSLEHAHRLISKTPFDSLISLFNPKTPRINTVVSEVLQVIMAYITKDTALLVTAPAPVPAAPAEEDSQEFEGFDDWDDIHAVLAEQNEPREEVEHMQRVLYPVVHRLLSNCFGADNSPEDAILMNVVDLWASLASALVRHGLQRWDNYLSQFGDRSWAQLRQTLQTRKYAAQFLALCIEKDTQIVIESRNLVIGMWMSSLVERSSMLKFQHRLTEALLNGNPRDLVLKNLPFVKDERDNKYHVSLQDLSQRRVSLLSSILSNMRDHVLQLEVSGSRDLGVTKQEYSELLQQLMTAMKDNYRELGNGAAESAQGAYVEFVHCIVRFLQELASDIRPVDPFFTDPALFPLPSSDPRYIVAKLKRYEPKMSSNKEVQTLTMFIQSIVERATIERQQDHLIEQLHTAAKDTYEAGRPNRPTLRAVLLQCVFPAYLELSFSTQSAWLVSRPIIQSTSLLLKDLLLRIDFLNPTCVSSLLRIMGTVFQSAHHALRDLSTCPRRFKNPVKLSMLAQFLKMVSSALVVVDYLDRVTDSAEFLISYVQWFRDLSRAVSSELSGSTADSVSDATAAVVPALDLGSDHVEGEIPQHLITSRRFALEDHKSYLKNWSFHEGKYYYSRSGHESKELILDPEISAIIQDEAKAKEEFDGAVAEFSNIIERLGFLPPM